MKGTRSHGLLQTDLLGLVAGLQEQLAARNPQVDELRKQNPTTRLDEAYSLQAAEK